MLFLFALRNLFRRPVRTGLTLAGLASAIAVLAGIKAFEGGYRKALGVGLSGMGMQMMLVPLGCPYDAAARVLKGKTLDSSLPDTALQTVRNDPAVETAAPLLIVAAPQPARQRVDMWVGLDETGRRLKPWWRAKAGAEWFSTPDQVILGSEAAEVELRVPGDKLFSPEANRSLQVAGVLERSGTSDDSLFFVSLETAQAMFHQTGRLTAIAIRLHDPATLRQVTERLQQIPGCQVVTMTEMMGTFLNLLGSVRTLSRAMAILALAISILSVLNTMLAAVLERIGELAVMRAIGASRAQVFGLIAIESVLLGISGSAIGLAVLLCAGGMLERGARAFVPFAPPDTMLSLSGVVAWACLGVGAGLGVLAGSYPAWRASRVQPAWALKEST